jgi:hypothetical protein
MRRGGQDRTEERNGKDPMLAQSPGPGRRVRLVVVVLGFCFSGLCAGRCF